MAAGSETPETPGDRSRSPRGATTPLALASHKGWNVYLQMAKGKGKGKDKGKNKGSFSPHAGLPSGASDGPPGGQGGTLTNRVPEGTPLSRYAT